MKHIIVTPVYNEGKYLNIFINSVINQSVLPSFFILVDDNSTDNSAQIIKRYCNNYNWIKYIYHPSSAKKVQGSKVIEAFNFGIKQISFNTIDIISKIDADLELPDNYFQKVIETFQNNPKAGLVGGFIREMKNGVWVDIPSTDYHIRGALKSYRMECYKEIGGLMPILGWDGLDEMKLFYYGWETKNFNLGVKHYRPADNDYDPIKLSVIRGEHNYRNGGNLLLAIVRGVVRLKEKPYLIVGLSFLYGYMKAIFHKEEKNVDRELAKFINKFHCKRLFRLMR